ncbi:hypothetical protein KAR91_36595 [Candidatus Pacearchaeota archaeon]|nr:hypothetical protein [Candidatus Pacearchaeota archaeon]
MDKKSKAWKRMQEFANEHKLILEDKGEVGFGRPCVGIIGSEGYIEFNPMRYKEGDMRLNPDLVYAFPDDKSFFPPPVEDAYHKHECLCVLVHDDDYDKALIQLDEWIQVLIKKKVVVVKYPTGANGMAIVLQGVIGSAFRLESDREDHGLKGEIGE